MVAKEDIEKQVYFTYAGTVYKGILKYVYSFFNGICAELICRIYCEERNEHVMCDGRNVFTNKRQMIKFICDTIPSKIIKNAEYVENYPFLSQEEKKTILNQNAVYIVTNYAIRYGVLMATRISYKYSCDDSQTIIPSHCYHQFYDLNSNVMVTIDKEYSKIYNTKEELLTDFSRKIKEL